MNISSIGDNRLLIYIVNRDTETNGMGPFKVLSKVSKSCIRISNSDCNLFTTLFSKTLPFVLLALTGRHSGKVFLYSPYQILFLATVCKCNKGVMILIFRK